jgi:hypothetical protein
MPDADAVPAPPSPWDLEFEHLRQRFPGAKPSVLFCVHAFMQRPDINIADLKAQAQMHGLKVSVGSWVAARQLLSPPATRAARPDPAPAAEDPPRVSAATAEAPPSQPTAVAAADESAVLANPPTEAPPKAITADDAEGPIERMVRLVVAGVQAAGDAKAERLRTAIREALAVIEAALADDSEHG